MKKGARRDANTARALAVVRFGHRPPARCKHQSHRQDRYQYTAPLSLARSVMKKALGGDAKPKIPPRRRLQSPFSGARDGQNLISYRDGHYPQTQFRVIVVTDPQTNTSTNPHTDSANYNTLRRR